MTRSLTASHYGLNKAWLDASMIACILLSWLKFLALDGDLARAEPKTLRYRVLHAAARLVRGGRRRALKIAAPWPPGRGDRHRLAARPGHLAPHLTSANQSRRARKEPLGPVEPRPPGPTAGPPSYPGTKIQVQEPASPHARGSHQPLLKIRARPSRAGYGTADVPGPVRLPAGLGCLA